MGIYTNKYIPRFTPVVLPNANQAGFEVRTQDDKASLTLNHDEWVFTINDQKVVVINSNGIDVGLFPGDMQKATYDTNNDGIVDHADLANHASQISGAQTVGNSKYYGTDGSGNVGFHNVQTITYTGVSSIFGRTGDIVSQSGDYTAAQVVNAFDIVNHDADNINAGVTNKFLTTSSQSVEGVKTFTSFPVTPSSAPTLDYQVANRKYVTDSIAAITDVVNKEANILLTADTPYIVSYATPFSDTNYHLSVTIIDPTGNPVLPEYTSLPDTNGFTVQVLVNATMSYKAESI